MNNKRFKFYKNRIIDSQKVLKRYPKTALFKHCTFKGISLERLNNSILEECTLIDIHIGEYNTIVFVECSFKGKLTTNGVLHGYNYWEYLKIILKGYN